MGVWVHVYEIPSAIANRQMKQSLKGLTAGFIILSLKKD